MIYILMLTFNRLEVVERCFKSLAPTLARADVCCVALDSGSTDGTADYLAGLAGGNHETLLSYDNLGVAGGRAKLLSHIASKLKDDDRVLFLDSDTVIVSSDWLDVLSKALESESVGAVGPGGSMVKKDWSGFTAGAPGEVDCIAGYCQLFKAEVLKAGVSIDTTYKGFWTEDSSFCLSIRESGFDVLCVPCGVMHTPSHSGFGQDVALHDEHIAMFREQWRGKKLIKAEGGY